MEKNSGQCPAGVECQVNYEGSSGGMEADGVVEAILGLYSKYGVKVTKYLGDGDSRAYTAVKKSISELPEEEKWEITKLECVNHVAKRIYYQLGVRKGELKDVNVDPTSKKTGIGGRNLLTNVAVKKIQSYYSWIIYSSEGDVKKMKKRIMAMCDHIGSTNQEPKHDECDPYYCKYMLAGAETKGGQDSYDHDKHFHIAPWVMEQVRPVFEKMSDDDLLEKTAHGKTQNANECANSTVWNLLSKNNFANRYLVELVVSMATCLYNEGRIAVLDVLSSLGVPISENMIKRCIAMDRLRVKKKQRAQEIGKNRRKKTPVDDDGQYAAGAGEYE